MTNPLRLLILVPVLLMAAVPAASASTPAAPTNVATSDVTSSAVTLSWSPVSGARSYDVYLGGYRSSTTSTSFRFTQLSACSTYTLGVRSRGNKAQVSAWVSRTITTAGCSGDTVAPSMPTGLKLSNSTSSSVTMSWDPSTDNVGVTQYRVRVGGWNDTTTGTSYNFSQLSAGTSYTLEVRAEDAAGNASPYASMTYTPQSSPLPTPTPTPPPPSSPMPGLHVSGNQLLDGNGNAVHLHGVNRSGTEYACIQGWGIFDGPSDDASLTAIRSWNSNVVHIGLNEDCILGINGVPAAYAGSNYMNAIVDYVNRLHAHGLYAEVSLMWAAPGSQQAQGHPAILDQDHSPAALQAIANAFKDDPDTFIGLQSEPHDIGWACWRDGGSACSVGYSALGMQGALNAVRSTGATNPVTVSGIDWANNLQQWLTYKPSDPQGQLMAEAHVYGGNSCMTTSCFDTYYAPVAAQVPVVFGETGETYNDSSCGSTNTSTFMNWADAHNVGYEAWVWDTWGNCESLISDYAGTPANQFGSWVKAHYLAQP